MQIFLKKLTDNSYLLPLVVVAICIWRIFVAQLPANAGLGWDGVRYYQITADGLESKVIDSYLILRIFPCLFVHVLFKLASIAFTPANVIMGFKIMNTVLIGLSALMVKSVFNHYKLNPVSQVTGFVLVFLNYGVLYFTFYYPVMTDAPAFFLSIALFYFFIKGDLTNVFLVGLIGAFTFPVIFPMAFALLLFSKKEVGFAPVNKLLQYAVGAASAIYSVALGWYLIFVKNEITDFTYTLPINHAMLPVTFGVVALLFFFMPIVLFNKTFFQLHYYRSQLSGDKIFAAIALVFLFAILRFSLVVNVTSEYATLYHQLKVNLFYAFQYPFITVVSHFNYFGCVILLMLLFWKNFSAFISSFGLGVAGSVFVCLFAFSMKPESRALIFFFPWMMILMSLYLGKSNFNKAFYMLIFTLNFITAKLWLFFDYNIEKELLLKDGTFDFPNQWFMMHLGIWMSEYVWLWLCIVVTVSLLLFIFSLYKIEFGKKEILFYKKYEPLTYE